MEEEQKAPPGTLAGHLDERERLLDDQEDADLQLNQARKNLESRQAERSRAEQALRDTRRTLVQVETAQVQVKAHQNELTNRIDTLRKNHQGIAKTLENEAQLLQQLQTRLEKQLEARDQAAKAQKNAEDALDTQRRSIADLETRRSWPRTNAAAPSRTRSPAGSWNVDRAERSLSGWRTEPVPFEEARRGA